jgi:hypothetical protein
VKINIKIKDNKYLETEPYKMKSGNFQPHKKTMHESERQNCNVPVHSLCFRCRAFEEMKACSCRQGTGVMRERKRVIDAKRGDA